MRTYALANLEITMNEPLTFATDTGTLARGRCSKWVSSECIGGVSSTEPYIVGHNMLLAHAAAVQRFNEHGHKYLIEKCLC